VAFQCDLAATAELLTLIAGLDLQDAHGYLAVLKQG